MPVPRQASPRAELRTETALRMVPGVLQALSMIAVAQPELVGAVDRALADNPMLLRRAGAPCPGCGCHRPPGARCVRCTAVARPAVADPAVRPFETLEARAGWEIRPECRAALPVVIAHLTRRGLLDDDPGRIAAASGLPAASIAEAVRAVRVAGPPGIAERSVRDLLTAQARALAAGGDAPGWLPDLVHDHLEAVAAGDVRGVAEALARPEREVADAIDLVRRRLRPDAAPDEAGTAGPAPAPDVFVYRADDGELRVEVPDSGWFGLGLVPVAPALRADRGAVAWLARHERDARDLLFRLDVRAGVLRRVATCAVRRQAGFLSRGAAGHAPLTRTEVAVLLGLHPSTVSRCVAGKTLRAPDGRLLPLAGLFGGAVAVKARIAALLAAADLSDAQVSRALAAEGRQVARRTVAKYRAELGIGARRT